jgi:hypothetical protein
MPKHHCSALFILPTPKTLQSAIASPFSSTKQFLPAIVLPFSFLLLKHHYQQPFIIFPDVETPLYNNFSLFSDVETPLFSTFYSSHSKNTPVRHCLTIFINETIPSSNCFAFFFSVAETPLSATLHHFSRC